jgi:uncharacterized membrane protein SpoIIM required for sporulation
MNIRIKVIIKTIIIVSLIFTFGYIYYYKIYQKSDLKQRQKIFKQHHNRMQQQYNYAAKNKKYTICIDNVEYIILDTGRGAMMNEHLKPDGSLYLCEEKQKGK